MSKYLKNISFYHTPLFLAKKLYNSNQFINDEIVKHINDAWIKFKKDINGKNISENENPEKILLKKSLILITNKNVKDFHVY